MTGNRAKGTDADRRRFFDIARGSALEWGAVQDVSRIGNALEENEHQHRKKHLDRIAAMLSRLGGRGYSVREEPGIYDAEPRDFDNDFDSDFDYGESQQDVGPDAG